MEDTNIASEAGFPFMNDDTELAQNSKTNGPPETGGSQEPPIGSPLFSLSTVGNGIGYHTKGGICATLNEAIDYELKFGKQLEPNLEKTRVRRMISNRLSAKKTRFKKATHILDLEKKAKYLETTVAMLSPQIEQEKQQQLMLKMENSILEQNLETFTEIQNLKSAQLEDTKAKIKKLKDGLITCQQEKLIKQEEELMPGWDGCSSELDELTSATFYLECQPQLLSGTNSAMLINDLDHMPKSDLAGFNHFSYSK